MSQLSFSAGKFSESIWQKFVAAVRNAVAGYDFDTGWVAMPSDKIFKHNLGVLPRMVLVYGSANADGSAFENGGAVIGSVTSTQITLNGADPFVRVLINK